MDVGRYK